MLTLSRFNTAGLLAIGAFLLGTTANAAVMSTDYTIGAGSQLLSANGGAGSILFHDVAQPGGNQDPVVGGNADFNAVLLPGAGLWDIGDTVSITGVALVIKGNVASQNSGNFTFSIREVANSATAFGRGGFRPILGSATASYVKTGAVDTMWVNFDAPITFVADARSTTVGIQFGFDGGQVAYKAENNSAQGLVRYNVNNGNIVGGTTPSYQRWSVAGSVTPATTIPEPTALATALVGLGGLACRRRRREM